MNKQHNMSNTKIYYAWANMMNRTTNPNHPQYKDYGAQGRGPCKRWLKFAGFLEDMHETHEEGLLLGRIDNSKGYNKENCRWVTMQQLLANRRKPVGKLYTYKGESKQISDWAKEYGLNKRTLYERIQMGWGIERALTTPTRSYQQKKH